MKRVLIFLLPIITQFIGCEGSSTDEAEAGIQDVAQQDAGEGDVPAPDVELSDIGRAEQILMADIASRLTCNAVCTAAALACNPDHSWMFGTFIGGGLAEYGPQFEATSAISCDAQPPADNNNYQLTRYRCACH